jgi:hypothetical protein
MEEQEAYELAQIESENRAYEASVRKTKESQHRLE